MYQSILLDINDKERNKTTEKKFKGQTLKNKSKPNGTPKKLLKNQKFKNLRRETKPNLNEREKMKYLISR